MVSQEQKNGSQELEQKGKLSVKIGGTVVMSGVELRVHHVHAGKRRITLVPVSPDITVEEI